MGRHRSPFTELVFLEWDELVLDKGWKLSLEERRRRAQALLDKTFIGGEWTVGACDAGLVASLVGHLALGAKDWSYASEVASRMKSHPDFGQDEVALETVIGMKAIAEALCGNWNALQGLSDLIRMRKRPPHGARLWIGGLVQELGAENPVRPDVVRLTVELILAYPNKKRLAKRAALAKTNRDLLDAIDGTYDRRPRSEPQPE